MDMCQAIDMFFNMKKTRNENNLHTIIRIYRNVCDLIFIYV